MRSGRTFISLSLAVFFVISVFFIFSYGCRKSADEQQAEHTSSEATRGKGKDFITLGEPAQKKAGIVVSKLRPMSFVKEIHAYGSILQLEGLSDLRKKFIEAQARVEDAVARLAVSKKEYERLKALNEDNKNVSDRALQSAEAIFQTDGVDEHASRDMLAAVKDASLQQYGEVITKWLFEGSPDLYRLVRQQALLIQVTLPPGTEISSVPATASIETAGGALTSAQFVSRSPRTDPRIQGPSFFYMTSANNSLLPGMNVTASLPLGARSRGFFVPASSVVWWQARPWVYLRKDTDQFVRKGVSTENAVQDGYFIARGFKARELIVVKGAQMLLSQELRGEIQGGED